MSRLVGVPWPVSTVVELYPPRGLSGSGEPTMAPIATGTVAAAGNPPKNEVQFSTFTEAGPMIATALVSGKRASVKCRFGS